MKKILIATTHTDIIDRLNIMKNKKILPEAEYYIVAEFYEEVAPKDTGDYNLIVIKELEDIFEIDKIAKTLSKYGPFDYIVQTDEYAIVLAAYLREKLGFKDNLLEDNIKFRDKVIMKNKLKNKVKIPTLYSLEDANLNKLTFPLILKPRTYAGSKGIHKMSSIKELNNFIINNKIEINYLNQNFKEFSLESYELEEFIEGDIYHIDGLIYENKIIFIKISKYLNTCLDYLEGKALGSISIENDVLQESIWKKFAQIICMELQIPDGAFHLEAFQNLKEEPTFLEIAARPGGALVVKTIETACGINLDEAHLLSQLGVKPILNNKENSYFGWLIFPKTIDNKVIKKIELNKTNSSLFWMKLPLLGEQVSKSTSYNNNLGGFIFINKNYSQIENDINDILHNYRVEFE